MHDRASSLRPLLGAFAVLALCAGDAVAGLYKWTDASGRVVYSDQPPVGAAKVEQLASPPPPANPNAPKELANKEMEYKQRQLDALEASKKSEKEQRSAEQLAANCEQVRDSLARLGSEQLTLYRVNEKGERVVMDDVTRRAERDRLVKWVRDNKCPL